MSFKTLLSRRRLTIILAIGLVLSLAITFQITQKKSTAQSGSAVLAVSTATPHKQQAVAIPGFPIRIKIPKISVDAALDYVVLTPKGELGAPKKPSNAGWFARGPRPGETGSSVIDGHFGWVDNTPAVFDDLHKLTTGDKLYIEDERGATIAFVVRELRTYDQNEDASSVFYSNDGRAHLNLITCEGAWNEALRSYSNRLVVFADKE